MADTTFVPGGGSPKYQLIVVTDTGSTVTATKGDIVKQSKERNGIWGFKGLEAGEWVITCTKGSDMATRTVTIVTGEVCQVIELGYQLYASDLTVYLAGTTTPATLGTDYEVVYDNDTAIPQELWSTEKNWKYRCLVNIDVVPLKNIEIDVSCVGGGGAGAQASGGATPGGGGGYTSTVKRIKIIKGTTYLIIVGSGGKPGENGGTTSAFGVTAKGGFAGVPDGKGGDGGSGGGGKGGNTGGTGGVDGSDGSCGNGSWATSGGKGQGTTTREFDEPTGKLYAGGGAGGSYDGVGGDGGGGNTGVAGTENTGGGGGGKAHGDGDGLDGGSGIVVFRNARSTAETTDTEVA